MNVSVKLLAQSIRYSLLASVLNVPVSQYAFAEQQTETTVEQEAEQQHNDEDIEVFQVTGSRISQTSFEGPNPVTVITGEDMAREGHITLFDALRDLSQNTGLVDTSEVGASGFTPNANVINLRGFGPQYTLTLINGRRLANYPAAYQSNSSVVNIGTIPTAAIERVEVLTTGASAIYGSDAVSGVINVILKKDVDDSNVALTYGTGEEHNKDNYRLQLTHGIDLENGNITLIGEYASSDYIKGGDLEDIDSAFDYPYGDPVMARGAVQIDNWAAYDYLLNPTGEPTYVDAGEDACSNLPWTSYEYRSQLPEAEALGQTGGSWGHYCGFDNAKYRTLRPETEKFAFMLSANHDMGGDVSGFIDLLYTQNTAETDHGHIAVNGGTVELESGANQLKVKGPNGQYLVMPDWYTLGRILPSEEIGDTAYHFDEESLSITLGIEGYLGDHAWEVYFTDSRYELDTEQQALRYQETEEMFFGNYLKEQLGVKVYDGTGTHSVYDRLSQEDIRRLVGTTTTNNKTEAQMASAVISGDMFDMPSGPAQYAAVLEYVNEEFEYQPDELMTMPEGEGWWGLAGFGGFGERSRSSAGLETKFPVSDYLNFGFAIRYDQYDSASTANDGQYTPAYNVEFRPNDEWLFRASYSRSFKAPDMQAIFTRSRAFSFGTDYVSCYEQFFAGRVSPSEFVKDSLYYSQCLGSTFNAEQLPNTELENEEGTSIGLGFVYSPMTELTIKFDYYDVEIRNQVQRGDISSILIEDFHCRYGTGESAPIFGCDIVTGTEDRQGLVIRNENPNSDDPLAGGSLEAVNTTAFNLASYRQTGIDSSIDYLLDIGAWGDLKFGINHTGILTTEYDALADDDQAPYSFSDNIANREPQDIVTASVSYFYENFAATLSARYMSELAPRRIQPKTDENGQIIFFDKYGDPLNYQINDDGEYIVQDGYYEGEDARLVGETKRSQKRLDPYITANLVLAYAFNEGDTNISLTVQNVFDEKAPKDDTFMATEWPWYDIYSYSGSALGREYFIQLSHHF
ncbi:TonB-dependent receptor [Thalassotalea sp. Y01]|uniref:TonB-dependent receptor plug domain-containing protein n=1 Tax=Thalassotalea sp. Y01 TaxID=2729613 RepID=UPI00145F0F19|nr:TonB-dependent receptor [Thalassotalea sp. Y01]NMP15951.1 TonB-dependent receptor [Thalassotalea sp. Y01]